MKKLMIVAAIVCAAAMAQAGSFKWKTAKSNAVNSPDGLAMVSATAYIFEASAAESVYNAWAAGNDWTVGNYDSATIGADGKISVNTNPFVYGTAGQADYMDAIFAFAETINGKDYLYISTVAGDTGPGTGSVTLNFEEAGVSKTSKTAYAGAGWYTAAAVPEPTSGLLLLLGVAGMALRRRRA